MGKIEVGKKDKKLEDILNQMTIHGNGCGVEIASYLSKFHPNAHVIPLYRSAIAIEKNKDGNVWMYCCGDPHCMGEEINENTIKAWEVKYLVSGQRFGVEFYKETFGLFFQLNPDKNPHGEDGNYVSEVKPIKKAIQKRHIELEEVKE